MKVIKENQDVHRLTSIKEMKVNLWHDVLVSLSICGRKLHGISSFLPDPSELPGRRPCHKSNKRTVMLGLTSRLHGGRPFLICCLAAQPDSSLFFNLNPSTVLEKE